MVLQRGGAAVVTGRASAPVVARVGSRRFTAKTRAGQFTLKLNLPAGGPYTITLEAGKAKLVVKDVLVGDVWICAGQSNMQGVGWLRHADKPMARVRAFYMDDRWAVAKDSIHNMWDSVDEVHALLNGGTRLEKPKYWGVGPAVAFGQEMLRRTGVPQGLLACAHGGTSMAQWSPEKKSEGSKSLYGAMVRRVAKNGGRVAGLIWYQGESDTNAPDVAAVYSEKMRQFVSAVRQDLRSPRLPVALVQIGRYVNQWGGGEFWNSIQDQQRRLPRTIPQLTVVPAVDLPLDDAIHVGGTGLTQLGQRLAEAMHVLRGGKGARPPLAFKRAYVVQDKDSTFGNVVVEFDNVTGKLVSGSRPTGFSLVEREGIFDTVLDGNKVLLRTFLPVPDLQKLRLVYGAGTNPYCNILDQNNRALPVFGPVNIGKPIALTGFAKPRVTSLLPGAGKLEGLTLPVNPTWRVKPFLKDFCDLHDELGAVNGEDKLVYFTCELNVGEPMKLAALLGYDGPVKLWVDGRELFYDPNGTNPGIVDAKQIKFAAAPGKHQVIIALGSNHGKAWGIYLRFQRLDVSPAKLRQNAEAYRLPEIS
ncbi:MAG: hypothetical protein PCFJNLEI_00167 [Verrucomicrobiae bacterium]|nr:hypothetical protein [Verrucomicrobiae bacterium]